ncbi:hypothetical protein RJ639_027717 [Escallonia herrerae]|uniref:Uncharacterized protein n=1 Tax=Escallonia herrerae TaxID=1293975 RepID=A0AA88X454_9ASTE|nr:hypothetical protein RJ639_027717 [Escallonia herrerae]
MTHYYGLQGFPQSKGAAKSASITKVNNTLESVRQFIDNFLSDHLMHSYAMLPSTCQLPRSQLSRQRDLNIASALTIFGYYLLARLLLDDIIQSDYLLRRLIIVASITVTTESISYNFWSWGHNIERLEPTLRTTPSKYFWMIRQRHRSPEQEDVQSNLNYCTRVSTRKHKNTLAGNVPPKANLRYLRGLAKGG